MQALSQPEAKQDLALTTICQQSPISGISGCVHRLDAQVGRQILSTHHGQGIAMGLLIADTEQRPINASIAVVAPGLHGVIDYEQETLL